MFLLPTTMKKTFTRQNEYRSLFLIVMMCSAPLIAHADYQNLKLHEDCISTIKERTQAIKDGNWGKLVELARGYMTQCSTIADRQDITFALNDISAGLNELRQYEDAIPIAKKCLSYSPENSHCLFNLGKAYLHTGENTQAQLLFQQVIDAGGYDTLTASLVDAAKRELAIAKALAQISPVQRSEDPPLSVLEAEPFIPITLPYRIKLQLPHNWVIADADQKQYVLSKTQSAINLSGIRIKDHRYGVLLIARPAQKNKYASMTISVQTTTLRYSDVEKMSPQDIQRWGEESRDALDKGLRASGGRLVEWIGQRRDTVAGRTVLIKMYKRDSELGKNVFVSIAQLHEAPRLISISLSAREGEESYWNPVVTRIMESIQFN